MAEDMAVPDVFPVEIDDAVQVRGGPGLTGVRIKGRKMGRIVKRCCRVERPYALGDTEGQFWYPPMD